MRRREFLELPFAAAAPQNPHPLERYFVEITRGFLENARKTSPTFAVCDFPDGTMLKGSLARSGKTYDSVTRMMPALAACVAGGRLPELRLEEVLRQSFVNAFDPACPDYWGAASPEHSDQRQVEASVVAWSLWLLRDRFLERLTSPQRARIQAWLASCTRVPVRRNNWAWFTAVNQAVRLSLSKKWTEFSGDVGWMIEDLEVLDTLAAPGDGWYSDSQVRPDYDYYNFWVFASHFLYWNRIAGTQYPEWSARFGKRLRLFLERAPYFFGANGTHVLFGRSLIYRWAVLTPLVLAYEQKLWPHSPGLLRRIVGGNLRYFWNLGALDFERGKLRETFSPEGTADIRESYIDNGHPYWGMQGFAFLLLPGGDPFWTAPEEPLPVERGDFLTRFEGTRMLLAGTKRSGQVRWLQSQNVNESPGYEDKYTKFSYSSHFPFNILKRKDRAAWDGTLVFRDVRTGACARRAGVKSGELLSDGVQVEWWANLGDLRIEVASRIRVRDEFEQRTHIVTAPALEGVELLEGSCALGLARDEEDRREHSARSLRVSALRSGLLAASWNLAGYDSMEFTEAFEESGRREVNIVYPRTVVLTLRAAGKGTRMALASLYYASPRPLDFARIARRAREWKNRDLRWADLPI